MFDVNKKRTFRPPETSHYTTELWKDNSKEGWRGNEEVEGGIVEN